MPSTISGKFNLRKIVIPAASACTILLAAAGVSAQQNPNPTQSNVSQINITPALDRLRQAEQAFSSSGQGGDFRSAISSAESALSQLQGEMQHLQSANAAPQQLIQQANLAIDNAQKVMKQPQGQ